MDPVRRGQLGLCADGGHPHPDFLQRAGRHRRAVVGGVSGLLGLRQLGGDHHHGDPQPDPGHSGGHERLQKAHLHTLRLGGHRGLHCHGQDVRLAAVPRHLCHCQGGLLGQPCLLRFHAERCDEPGTDGRSLLQRLCMGLHWQLCAVRGLSGPCAGGGQAGHQPDESTGSGAADHGVLVAADHAAAAETIQTAALCGGGAARHPPELCPHRAHHPPPAGR